MMTGKMNCIARQHEQISSSDHQHNSQRRPLILEDAEDEPDQFTSSPMDLVVTAINNLPLNLQQDATHTQILNTQVPNFRGSRNTFLEFRIPPTQPLETTPDVNHGGAQTPLLPEPLTQRSNHILAVRHSRNDLERCTG